jgi:hypothetical protein
MRATPLRSVLLSGLLPALLPLGLSMGCKDDPVAKKPVDTDPGPGLNVSERLGPGEVRAGTIADDDALFGGASAEGRVGDLKIYNDRVQFVIQGVHDSHYYEAYGGGVVDMDVVRPEGQPGRDLVDELGVMIGLGRFVAPDTVEVIRDGGDGQAAVVRVTGHGAPMTLLSGALETPDFIDDLDVDVVTTMTLEPDSSLLQMSTTVTWNDVETTLQVGDLAMVGMEVGETVFPGRGLDGGELATSSEWLGVVGQRNEVAMALMSDAEPYSQGAIGMLLSEIGPVVAGLAPATTFTDGSEQTWTRYVGVGPDLATLTDEWHAIRGDATQSVSGSVTAGGAPLAGARVHVLDGEALETIAFTGADGAWSADVMSSSATAVVTGRGHGNIMDLPEGAGWVAPYAAAGPAALALDSVENGALPIAFAEGYGISEVGPASGEVSLTAPGTLEITVDDGGPAVVQVSFAAGDPVSADRARVPGRPGGAAAWGYVRDGAMALPLEPGSYHVVVHRGLRWEVHEADIVVESGGSVSVEATLVEAVRPAGMLTADPHSHGSPSGDGDIPMIHRLMSHAANGVDVHIGTDHDHVADYRPLLAPLGLDGRLASVVADEVSPVLRGHFNIYPLEQMPDLPNMGAPRWWDGMTDTETFFQQMRDRVGPDGIISVNHPAGNKGMFGYGDYDVATGEVGSPDHFSTGFDSIEVLNDGDVDEFLPFYLDVTARGMEPTPVGVSDSHGYRNGVGENVTWVEVGTTDVAGLSPMTLAQAIKDRRVIVSRGPYIDATVDGAWASGQTFSGTPTLSVDVLAPSWMRVDYVDLYKDGELAETHDLDGPIEFELAPDADAVYIVMARGDSPMAPVYSGTLPWAMTAAIRVDVDGDGWTAPKAGLTYAR